MDLPFIPILLVVIITLYRIPLLYRWFKHVKKGRWSLNKLAFKTVWELIKDLTVLPFFLIKLVFIWRLFYDLTLIQKVVSCNE